MALPAGVKAQHIIEWFADLNLPVCDDDALITAKYEQQKPRRLAATTRSTTPEAGVEARNWFKHVTILQKQRREALDLVYSDSYRPAAEAVLAIAVGRGEIKLTTALASALAQIARKQCCADDAITRTFVDRLCQEKSIQPGGDVVRPPTPSSISTFAATSVNGAVRLTWVWPPKDCAAILITREESSAPSSSSKPTEEFRVTQGGEYIDRTAAPGQWYTYRACATVPDVSGKDVRGTPSVVRAPALAEVDAPSADLQPSGGIRLRWKSPAIGASIHIFRQKDKAPQVRIGADGVEAVPPATPLGSTTASEYADNSIEDGATYWYRLVVDFGEDVLTEGKTVPATVPLPPPPPASITAQYHFNAGVNEIAVDWKGPPGRSVSYALIRREGSVAPTREEDGVKLGGDLAQTRFLDKVVAPGALYTYAVFSKSGTLRSRTAAVASPVSILPDITQLTASPGDGSVTLRWKPPERVDHIVIRRRLNDFPRDVKDGEPVTALSSGEARDEKLRNGLNYCYLVCCAYKPDGRSLEYSAGARVAAVPDRRPEPARDLKAEPHGREVHCTWVPGAYGQDVVLRSAAAPTVRQGQFFHKNMLATLGDSITVGGGSAGRALAVDTRPNMKAPFYTVYTTAGDHAVAGPTVCCLLVPDVTGLRANQRMSEVTLQWDWPPDCKAVAIARRENAWPTGPRDRDALVRDCTLSDYEAAGNKFIDTIPVNTKARHHYIVYALANGPHGQCAALATEPSCRAIVAGGTWMTLAYRILPDQGNGARLHLVWRTQKFIPDFAGFRLLAAQTNVPVPQSADQVELYCWKPGNSVADGAYEAWVDLAPIRAEGWDFFHCKAFLLDPAQESLVLMVHPNTCARFAENGQAQAVAKPRPPRVYHPGTPRSVICPAGLEEFPVHKMQFAFGPNDAPEPGNYSWWQRTMASHPGLGRLLGHKPAIRPPTRNGDTADYKFCPDGHPQPRSAGLQASLTIGLIGAKYSGKTHYVASLVKQLYERVQNEIPGALWPADNATSQRYKELRRLLFEERSQLDATVGEPAPLVYDLELNRALFADQQARHVNLALYDTAGENFQDEAKARETVKYLRVAAGVLLLVDPLQIDSVRARLPGAATNVTVDRDGTPITIMGNVLGLLEKHKVVGTGGPLATPIAVVMTKCDVLRDHAHELGIEPNRLWCMEERRHIGRFNRLWHEDMSGMMGECLRRWDPAAYGLIANRFPNHAFFGVSATGCAPDVKGHYRFVSPFRVEDPLLWLLTELGVVPPREDPLFNGASA